MNLISENLKQIKIKNADTWVVLLALLYVLIPIIIFLAFFTRPCFFVIGLILFLCLIYKYLSQGKTSGFSNADIFNGQSIIFFIVTGLLFAVWVYFSGIGSFSFQNWDFWVRNPIYNDLIDRKWPLYYNLSAQAENVRSLIGNEWVAFAYYFTFWLTPAGLCKLLNIGSAGAAAQYIIYIHSLFGIIIINYLLCRLFKKFSYKITLLFMGFSGLDVIAYLIMNRRLPGLTEELEWSLVYYQLSGNTTQLFYVFNQSIPVWIIMLLLLDADAPKITAAISAICFAYSPWATIGLVPIAAVNMFVQKPTGGIIFSDTGSSNDETESKTKNKAGALISSLKGCVSILNIIIPLFMLIIFGMYYTASNGSEGAKGLYYFTTDASPLKYIGGFVVFILTEFLLYYIAMGKDVFKYRYSIVVLLELTLFPLFYIVDFNFFIRGTIPALFILMVICISFVMDNGAPVVRRRILAMLLVIGALNSCIAFSRSVINTAKGGDYLESDIVTFDDMSDANEYQILTVNSQFFVHGFATEPFYLFISKRGL